MEENCIANFLCQRSPVFVKLKQLREEIWQNKLADEHFQKKQKIADNASPELKDIFRKMMCSIAKEMDEATQFLSEVEVRRSREYRAPTAKVLDLCMAPGGFADQVRLSLSPLTEINGITLPMELGGHDLLLEDSPRLIVKFLDITMLAADMGCTIEDIPLDHPERDLFSFDRPFFNQMYDLVFCDGQVLRTHKRPEYRDKSEGLRLSVSQLIFALQHIKPGGTLVMLLHKADAKATFKMIYTFNKFSYVRLFKPARDHAMRSSFYLVAKLVDPHSVAALQAVKEWKEAWTSSTIHFSTWRGTEFSDDEIQSYLAVFGEKFIELCEPMWEIQSKALFRNLNTVFNTPGPTR